MNLVCENDMVVASTELFANARETREGTVPNPWGGMGDREG